MNNLTFGGPTISLLYPEHILTIKFATMLVTFKWKRETQAPGKAPPVFRVPL